jgi:DNA-directed RNA polymerase beta' subunit
MNIHIAQSFQARNELKRIANVKLQIIGAKDSKPIIGCVQDSLSGAYMLTLPGIKLKGSQVSNFLCNTTSESKYEIDAKKEYTGHEIFSHIIPKGINSVKMSNGKKIFEIIEGQLITGKLDKSALSKEKNSIIHYIWDKYGPNETRKFIDDTQRLILNFLMKKGFTISFGDCIATEKMDEQVKKIINDKILEYKISLTQYENDTDQLDNNIIENLLSSELNAFSSNIGKILEDTLESTNNLIISIKSGAKGSLMNLQHMMGCIGQKSVEGTRIKKKIENRTLSIFHEDDDTPEARGFISSSFCDGLKSYEFFYDAMGGREGLIDTAIKTAKTGYIQRQLIKGLEDISIKYDNTNRNSKNIIIQYIYGENGIDQSCQSEILILIVDMNNERIENEFGFTKNEINKLTDKLKIKEKELIEFNKNYINKIKKYRDELRIIQMKATNNYKIIEEKYMLPVNIVRLTQFYSNNKEKIELKPDEINQMIEDLLNSYETKLLPGLKETDKYLINDDRSLKYLLEIAIHNYLCPKKCIFEYGLSKKQFEELLKEIKLNFIKALVQPGEMVGVVAAQSIGEPTSQMSLLYNESNKIIIKNKITNEVSMISTEIGTFCDDIIIKNPELTFNTGHYNSVETSLDLLDNEYYIIGVDSEEKTHWNKISHVSRHPVNGQMMKVTTKSGRYVNTTTSHSHLIRQNQTVLPILGSELVIGMRIPVAKYIDNTFIKYFIEIDNIKYKLDYLFGWLIGIYLAKSMKNQNDILNTDKSITEEYIFQQYCENIKQIRELYIDENEQIIFLNSNYFKSLCTTEDDNVIKIPDFVFLAPNEFKAGLLQAYFDESLCFDQYNQINIYNYNEQIIKDISLLLNYFDIFSKIKCISGIYNLSIHSKYNFIYKYNIGSILHYNKINVHSTLDDCDKINDIGKIITFCGNELLLQGQSRNYEHWQNKEAINRTTIKYYINIFENNENAYKIQDGINALKQAVDSNVIWDEIIKIEIYDIDQSNYVYDFTVPANQTFMTDYGIIVHNTLNTKHGTGASSSKGGTRGVPRIEELLHYSKDIKTPMMTVYFNDDISNDKLKVNKIASYFKYLSIKELIESAEILYDLNSNDDLSQKLRNDNVQIPFFINNQKAELSSLPFVFRIKLDMEKMYDKETTLLDIKTKFISYWHKNFTNYKNMKKNEKEIFSKISRCAILNNNDPDGNNQIIHIRFNMISFNYTLLIDFLKIILEQITLKGLDNITGLDITNERRLIFDSETGNSIDTKEYIVYTSGINIEKLKYIKGVDMTRTTSNDIYTIYKLYGIEAARQILLNEFLSTFMAGGSKINHNHMSVLIDMMTHNGIITSIDRHGLSKVDSDPLTKASFEKTMDHFINAALFNEKDSLKSVSARVMLGKVIHGGTGAFEILLDTNKLENSEYTKDESGGRITFIPLEEETIISDIIKYGNAKTDFFIPN